MNLLLNKKSAGRNFCQPKYIDFRKGVMGKCRYEVDKKSKNTGRRFLSENLMKLIYRKSVRIIELLSGM
jgi:hypothetical protein